MVSFHDANHGVEKVRSQEHATPSESSLGLLSALYNDGGAISMQHRGIQQSYAYTIVSLVEQGFVNTLPSACGTRLRCELTHEGIRALKRGAGRDMASHLTKQLNVSSLCIERAVENRFSVGSTLCLTDPDDFLQQCNLQIWGRLDGCLEPVLVGDATLTIIDAEAATLFGDLTLPDIIRSTPQLRAHSRAFENHDLDGELACHIYEFIDMLDLEEAAGASIILIEDIKLDPSLIGHGVGQRLIKKLMIRYGKGGGVVILPVKPYGASEASPAYQSVVEKLSQNFAQAGFGPHPFAQEYLVGSIRQVAGLPY